MTLTTLLRPPRTWELRTRVTVALGAATVVAVAAVALVAYALLVHALDRAARTAAVEETRAAVAVVRSEMQRPDPPTLEELDRDLAVIGPFEAVLVGPAGVATSTASLGPDDVPAPPPTAEPTSGGAPTVGEVEAAGRRWLVTRTSITETTTLSLFFPVEGTRRDLAITGEVIGLTALVVALLGLALSASISRRVLAPISATAAAARELAVGALDTRVPDEHRDPSDLTATFNEMAAALERTVNRLETAAARQRRFVADVSHELRTPVTALSAATDLVEPQLDRLDGSARRAATLLVEEVRHLRALVEDLMEISRLEPEDPDTDLGPVDVAALVPRVLAQRGHEDVDWSVPDGALPVADPRRLAVIIGNLVDNALRHGAPPVTVIVAAHGDRLHVEVTDHGDGIPPGLVAEVFERFTKTDGARTRGGGSGLGLAIARQHARLMGGDIVVVDHGPGRTRFRLDLARWVDDPGTAPVDRTGRVDRYQTDT